MYELTSDVAAFEDARIVVGPTFELDGVNDFDLVERTPTDRSRRLIIRALGPVTLKIGEESGACVLLPQHDGAVVEADAALEAWWEATLAQTSEYLKSNAGHFGDPLARLRDARAR